jgi:hypothetical protein
MGSVYEYYTTAWNPNFSGDSNLLHQKIDRACDTIANNINTVDFFDLPYYLLDNVRKAICVQADESEDIPAENYSYKIGNFSVSEKTENKKTGLCEKARCYLINTGLLRSVAAVI